MKSDGTLSENVEVKLELGHRASLRGKTTSEGYTHDWTLFVRGPDGNNIQHFVEKVVFFLHESFPKPKRVLKEPPYTVSESGYAGFNLAIEVHFRNKEDPKKVRFDYDLYLHLEGPPIQNSRLEKLTFQNPNSEFKKKLLKGGGVAISGGSQSNTSSNFNPVQTETEQTPKAKSIKGSNEGPKKTPKVKLPHVAKEVPSKAPDTSQHPFTHIFGAPIKTKPSPETSHKSKENAKEKSSSSSGSSKTTTASASTSSSLSSSQNKSTSKEPHKASSSSKEKVSKQVVKETEKKESKSNSENKSSGLKRASSPSPQSQGHKGDEPSTKKRRRSTSTSSATSSAPEKTSSSKEKKVKPKEGEQKKEHKAVAATPPPAVVPPKKETHKQSKPSQVAPRKEPRDLKSPVNSAHNDNDQESVTSSGRARLESESSESSSSSQNDKETKQEDDDDDDDENNNDDGDSRSSGGSASSPSSSLTLSSITPGSAHGPLATMMAQMEQELVSPLSSDQASPVRSVGSPQPEEKVPSVPSSASTPPTPVKVEEPVNKKSKDKHHSEKTQPASKKPKEDPDGCLPPPLPPQSKMDGKQQPIDAAYLRELMQLQERIMALRDKQHLQRIVDVIEETGLYQITSSTIDFDLCALDRSTVQKLQNCMTVT